MKHLNAVKKYGAGLGTLAMASIGTAHAELPAAVATTFTSMQADFEEVFGLAFAVLAVITLAMIAWRYTRKLGNKL